VGRHTTVTYNSANESGGGIRSHSSDLTVCNSIFWADSPNEFSLLSGSSINIIYSDIQGGWEGEGNIDADPMFVDADNGDYQLQADSPCIDAGTPDCATDYDIDGNPRDDEPDMGAYECQRGAIIGHITDCQSDDPIPIALVIAINLETLKRNWSITGRDGHYELLELPAGRYLVIVFRRGYKPGLAIIEVKCGETITHDFCLEPKLK
jgi:predicted outer membrane repeat protein